MVVVKIELVLLVIDEVLVDILVVLVVVFLRWWYNMF